MFFKRKGWLRKEYDDEFVKTFMQVKQEWSHKASMVERSVDPSEEVMVDIRLAKMKYLFLLKEAKHRNISINRMS
ncbi:YaaL family protein [Priestia megaterium]